MFLPDSFKETIFFFLSMATSMASILHSPWLNCLNQILVFKSWIWWNRLEYFRKLTIKNFLKSSATVILMWRSSGPIFDFPIAINHFHTSLWNKINVEMVSKTKNGFQSVLEKWKLTEESIENLLYYDENSHRFWEWVFWEFVRAYRVIHGNFSCQDSIHGIRSHRHNLRSLDRSSYRDRIFWVCFLTHYKNSKW